MKIHRQIYNQIDRHLAQLGIREISEHIDHLAKCQGIEGFKGLNVFYGLKGFKGLKGI